MTATQLAAKTITSPPAGPLDETEAAQEQARSEAAAVTAKIAELIRSGPGFDQTLHARLKHEQESALKALRAADLQLEEQRAAATAPIPARALSKIRAMRRRVADSHSALLTRQAEANHLRGHLQGVRNSIAALENSSEFKRDQQGVVSTFVWGKNGKEPGDHRAPVADHRDSPQTIKMLAELERDLERTITEAALSATVQAEASAKWTNAKSTLDVWESAVRAQGPAAARALSELPQAGAFDDQNLKGHADISLSTPHALHQSQRSVGR